MATTATCEVEIAKILHTMQRSTPSPPPPKKRKTAQALAQEADQELIQKALPCRPPLLVAQKPLFGQQPPTDKLEPVTRQESPRSILQNVSDEGLIQHTTRPSVLRIPALRKQPRELEVSNLGISPFTNSPSINYLLSLHAYGSTALGMKQLNPLLGDTGSVFSHPQKTLNPVGGVGASLDAIKSANIIPLCQTVSSETTGTKLEKPSTVPSSRKRSSSGSPKPLKLCRMDMCNEPAARRTPYCSAHSGPRRCEKEGCNKCAQGRTRYCIAHGGGRRCTVEGCNKGARDRLFCAGHGGGRRCSREECTKLAVDNSGLCTAHGGGRRCGSPGCPRSAQSNTPFCVRHGGGRKCSTAGCNKVARGRSGCCMLHSRSKSQQN